MTRLTRGVLGLVLLMIGVVGLSPLALGADADREKQVADLIAGAKLDQAIEACRTWIKEDPEAIKPHILLGDVYTRMKLWDRAGDEYRQALDLNPASTTAHLRLGDLLRAQGKLPEAKAAYEQTLKVKDDCLEAYTSLASLCLAMGKPGDARPYAEMALQIAPDNAQVLAVYGEIERLSGHHEQAGAKFKQALEKDPKCADALYGMGILVQAQGAAAEGDAQKYWDRFLEVEKDTERAWRVKYGLVDFGVKVIPLPPGIKHYAVFSPDGKMLAFQSHVASNDDPVKGWEITVAPVDGSVPPKPITTGGGAVAPHWTLDGKSIVFCYLYQPPKQQQWIFITPADGSAVPRFLTQGCDNVRGVVPIPGTDGLLYTDCWSLWTMKLTGEDKQKLPVKAPEGRELDYMCVSPDGKTVAVSAADFTKDWGPARQVYLAPLDGSEGPRPLTTEDTRNRLGNCHPSWGPDGKRMIFSSDKNDPKHSYNTYVVVLGDPHPPVKLAPGGRASWAPDGTKIVFDIWTATDPGAICIMELGGKRLPIVKP